MPAPGEVIAEYLLDLLSDGTPLSKIKQTATAIVLAYEEHRLPLNYAAVRGALAMAAAQLDDNRVLN
jgi:hypothetical protein